MQRGWCCSSLPGFWAGWKSNHSGPCFQNCSIWRRLGVRHTLSFRSESSGPAEKLPASTPAAAPSAAPQQAANGHTETHIFSTRGDSPTQTPLHSAPSISISTLLLYRGTFLMLWTAHSLKSWYLAQKWSKEIARIWVKKKRPKNLQVAYQYIFTGIQPHLKGALQGHWVQSDISRAAIQELCLQTEDISIPPEQSLPSLQIACKQQHHPLPLQKVHAAGHTRWC